MDSIWAPWRSQYINLKKTTKCIFCIKGKKQKDLDSYIIDRTKHSFSILNKYPYNNGHVMVAPYKHVKALDELNDEELLALLKLVNKTKMAINKALAPDGFNIGINMGKIGGAGFADHVHIHIVPRWLGDTNFMPICADVKVVSESLLSVYKRLKDVYKK